MPFDYVVAELFRGDRILQVLANLVGNAVKLTPAGGRIDVALERIDGGIRFKVADTGPSLAPDKFAMIFDRYWQSASSHGLGQTAGLGLGLYIARCIVEAHAGRILAEAGRGAGTTFYFTLPASVHIVGGGGASSGGGGSGGASSGGGGK